MKKILFRKLLLDCMIFFLITLFSTGIIIWIFQAVNYLDIIIEDGRDYLVYIQYSLLNFPKIISKIFPFALFFSFFYVLTKYELNNELIIFIPTCIIILREIMVSAIREWAAREDIKDLVEVNYLGKLKTFVQMISIGFLLFNGTIFTINIYLLGLYGINIAAFLSLLSMLIYLKNVIKP